MHQSLCAGARNEKARNHSEQRLLRERELERHCAQAHVTKEPVMLGAEAPSHTGSNCYVREKIRTPDLLIRSQTLYPAELRAQMSIKDKELMEGIEPSTSSLPRKRSTPEPHQHMTYRGHKVHTNKFGRGCQQVFFESLVIYCWHGKNGFSKTEKAVGDTDGSGGAVPGDL